jgi:protein ECT2
MYNDVNLPDDEAWIALTSDLRETKASRNTLSKENSYVFPLALLPSIGNTEPVLFSDIKQQIVELELQNEEYRLLLQANGLIP